MYISKLKTLPYLHFSGLTLLPFGLVSPVLICKSKIGRICGFYPLHVLQLNQTNSAVVQLIFICCPYLNSKDSFDCVVFIILIAYCLSHSDGSSLVKLCFAQPTMPNGGVTMSLLQPCCIIEFCIIVKLLYPNDGVY